MISAIVIGLLAFHLLCMNVSSAAPLLCLWLARARQPAESDDRQIAERLAIQSVYLLGIGAVAGLLVALVPLSIGDRDVIDALPLFRKKISWGVIELLCSAGWMMGYWAWLKWWPPQRALTRWTHATLAVLASTNLLYHFPPLLTLVASASSGEIEIAQKLTSADYRHLMISPNVMAHTLHFWLASFAVSAVYLFHVARKSADPRPYYVFGARVALVSTVLQLPVGLWLLMATPTLQQARVVGGDALVTGLFVSAMVCAYLLVQNLATLAFGGLNELLPRRCSSLMVATVVLMTAVLRLSRA